MKTALSRGLGPSEKKPESRWREKFILLPTPQRVPPVRIGASPPRSLALARIVAAFEKLVASSALAVEVRVRVHCMSNFQLVYPAAYVP